MNFFLFLVTVPTLLEGKKIAHSLVSNKLAARVNIVENVTSIYEWKGKVEENTESLLIIKTNEEKSKKLMKKVKELHSYETPECIGLKIDKGSEKYLNWIEEVLQ